MAIRFANEPDEAPMPLDAPMLMTVDELAEALRIGRTKAYSLCKEPGFPALRIRGQVRIPRLKLEKWLDAQPRVMGEDESAAPEEERETSVSETGAAA